MREVRASQVSLPDAQTQLWNLLFSFINSMSLGCAVELGRADIKHSHDPTPANLLDLAASIPTPPNKTSHLRRLLVHSGIFAVKKCDNGEGFVLIPMSSLIVQGRDESILSSFVFMMLDSSLVSPWHFLGEWFKGKNLTTAFRMYHGVEFWDKANQFPDFNRKFNTAMTCDGQYLMNAVVGKCANAFEGLRSLVDVGGGIGGPARAIAEAFLNIVVSVLDLPCVVTGLPEDSEHGICGRRHVRVHSSYWDCNT